MASVIFYAQFTKSKIGKNSLTVTWDVERIARSDGTRSALVTGGATNITVGRRGLYGYRLSDADVNTYDYIATAITADIGVDAQEVAALWTYWGEGVWTSASRTMTNFGTLVADIWGYVTRTLTSSSGGATAQEVWEYVRRTLTTPAHKVVESMVGSDLIITNGVTFTETISVSIPVTWQKIYFTAKSNKHWADSSSVLQIMVTNPAAVANDGITYLGGNVGGINRTFGSLTVDQPNGNLTIEVEDNVNFSSLVGKYDYDIKCLLSDGSSILLVPNSFLTVGLTPTKSIT